MSRSTSHLVPLKDGEEQSMLTGWRRVYRHKPGRAKAAKRSYNRRQRRTLKPTEES